MKSRDAIKTSIIEEGGEHYRDEPSLLFPNLFREIKPSSQIMTGMGDKWQRVTGSGCVGGRHRRLRLVPFPVYTPSLHSELHSTLIFPKAKPWLEESTKLKAAVQIVFFSILVFSWDSEECNISSWSRAVWSSPQPSSMGELHTRQFLKAPLNGTFTCHTERWLRRALILVGSWQVHQALVWSQSSWCSAIVDRSFHDPSTLHSSVSFHLLAFRFLFSGRYFLAQETHIPGRRGKKKNNNLQSKHSFQCFHLEYIHITVEKQCGFLLQLTKC